MASTLFRTSQDRQREELARSQGLRPSSGGLGPFSSMLKTADPDEVPISSQNIPASYLPSTKPQTTQIGTNMDGSPMSVVNAAPQVGSLMGIPELAAVPLAAATAQGTVTGVGNAIKGNKLSMQEQLALALPTFGLSFAFNPLVDLFGSGKGKQQQSRDNFRDLLVQQGIAQRPEGTDETFINLFGGGQFDAGKDGGNRLKNQDGTERRFFEVDMGSPGIGETISALNPLGILLANKSGTDQSAATGYLVNAVTSGGGDAGQVKNRILGVYQQAGISPDEAIQGLTQLAQQGKISDSDLKIHINSINGLSSPGQGMSLTLGGGGGVSVPQPKPQVDMSLMKGPSDPMAQPRAAYQEAQDKRLQLFPQQNQNSYQTLGAFK